MSGKREFPNWTGRRFPVEVGPVAHGGHCVTRWEGRVVFVRHAIPGERVLVEVNEDHGGAFCRADAVEILDASPDRVQAPCVAARPGGCGGCDWQHVSPERQRELKADVVAEQLQRLAKLDWPVTVEELPGGQLGWRTRVRMVANANGRLGFRGQRSHRITPVDDCPIATENLVTEATKQRWKPGTEVEFASDGNGNKHVAEVDRRGRSRQVLGDGIAVHKAAGRQWRLSASGFWQVHPKAADVLAGCVADWALAPAGGVAWDLYGGVGLFGAVLAEQVGMNGAVLVVESSSTAVRDGRKNLADLTQVRFQLGLVEEVITGLSERPDVVVLDPPRKGAGKDVVSAIAEAEPARVVYVACDPAALARDVATFQELGYRLSRLRAFDTFPMTHHVECVALLERINSKE